MSARAPGGPAAGEPLDVAPGIRHLLAPNPGPMTLDGTNTWLLGVERVLVVDPGPDQPEHVARVLAAAGPALAGVLLTHRHPDHAGALGGELLRRALADLPVLAADPALGVPVTPRALYETCDLPVEPLATPGHTDDSVCLVLPRRRAVLTGDTVLGRGTSVVAHPDGRLGDYLRSLAVLGELVGDGPWRGLPGHGPVLPDLARTVAELLAHRHERVAQVRAALAAAGRVADPADPETVAAVVEAVYPGVTGVLAEAARRTTAATLVHLAGG